MRAEAFGCRVKELREQRGITQLQLAVLLNVSRSTIANWEIGNRLPDISMATRLAECLGVETSALLDEPQHQEKPQVIVVEDLPVLLAGFVRLLGAELPGAEVTGFSSAAKALAFAREIRISLAFLDIELSGEDGLSLSMELTDLQPNVNIIFLTSHADYMRAALNNHCSGYILKPLTPEKIRHEIAHLRYPVRGLK